MSSKIGVTLPAILIGVCLHFLKLEKLGNSLCNVIALIAVVTVIAHWSQ